MKQEMKTESQNHIFTYAFSGALLFTAAFGFIIVNLTAIASFELPLVVTAGLLAMASVSLLYKAISRDRQRLRQN